MTNKKTIRLSNCEGHQYAPRYRTAWSDTYATFHDRRKVVHIGPTIVSLPDLLHELRTQADIQDEHPGCGYDPAFLPEGPWEFCLPYPGEDDGIPMIAVNRPYLDKGTIERAIGWYIRVRYGVRSELRFRWEPNRDRFYVTPVSLCTYRDEVSA